MLLTYPLMASHLRIVARASAGSRGTGSQAMFARTIPRSDRCCALVIYFSSPTTINARRGSRRHGGCPKAVGFGGPRCTLCRCVRLRVCSWRRSLEYTTLRPILKWLTLALFAYVITLAVCESRPGQRRFGLLVPSVHNGTARFLTTLVAILGTTISPYLFIWQSSQEAEEQRIDPPTKKPLKAAPVNEERGVRANSAPTRLSAWPSPTSSRLPSLSRQPPHCMSTARQISRRPRKLPRR